MSATIKIRVLSAFWLDRNTVAEVGQILELDPLVVYALDRSKAEMLGDQKRAQELINAAARASTEAATRAAGPLPLARTIPFALGGSRWH